MSDSRVSVVIPNWNGREILPRVLDSLREQTFPDFETVVVDNGSEDGSLELLRNRYPEVRIVALPSNRGFAGAVNAGIASGRSEIVALLNNDAVADPGWIAALVGALDAHPGAGSCASRMLDLAEPRRIDSAGDQLGIVPSNQGHGELDGERFRTPAYVLSACAGAAAYRRTLLEDLGGFDERFFAYMEDIDLGIRAQFLGFDCLYVPEAVVYHEGGHTSGRIPDVKFQLLARNSLFVFFQYMPPLRRVLWAPVVLARTLANARRRAAGMRAGMRAIGAALRDWRRIAARRRQVRRSGVLSWAEFRRRLAQPLAHPSISAPVLGGSGGARREVPRRRAAPVQVAAGQPMVDVIIVNWNGGRYLRRTLGTLRRASIPVRVLVVDNASSDDSLRVLREFPEVRLVALARNAGYAGGANAGIAESDLPFVFVMNPDVLLEPRHLEILADRLRAAPGVGVAQGRLYGIDAARFVDGGAPGREVLDSAGHIILPSRMVVDRGQGSADGPAYERECTVFSATGAAVLLRRQMLDEISVSGTPFDAEFFAYKEDIDLCWRARLLGWDVLYVPTAVGHHVRSLPGGDRAAWRRLPLDARRHSWKNHYLMIIKNDRLRDLVSSFHHVLGREVGRLGYALLRDPRLLQVYVQLPSTLRRALRYRRRVRASAQARTDLSGWFGRDPGRPWHAGADRSGLHTGQA